MDLSFYWRIFLRRIPYLIIFAALGIAIGVSIAISLPARYGARAVMIVESEQIPDELAASTVQTNAIEALQIIRQRILSREVLLELGNRLKVFELVEARGERRMSADDKVRYMRDSLEISTTGGGRGASGATIVTVAFSDAPSPRLAAEVTNEIVTLILQENVQTRTAVAGQTLEFFDQEVERLAERLSQLSAEILDFKENNIEALPDSLDFRRGHQAALQERLTGLARERQTLVDRRGQLAAIFEATGRTQAAGIPAEPPSPQHLQLEALREEQMRQSVVLSERNPRMKLLAARIAKLEAEIEAGIEAGPTGGGATPEGQGGAQASLLDIQLVDIDTQIRAIDAQVSETELRLADVTASIASTPGNTVMLSTLERDYDNIKRQYDRAVDAQAKASTGNVIESLAKGRRISVVEQAVAPERPTSPNRPLIALSGLIGGLALGGLVVALMELLNRSVRRPRDLETGLGIEPFATIPYMFTAGELLRRRAIVTAMALGLILGLPGALWYVDRNVRPLQPVLERLLDKIPLASVIRT